MLLLTVLHRSKSLHCNSASNSVLFFQFPASDRSYQEIQITLNNNAINLNQAATDIVGAAATSPHQVAQSSSQFGRAYEDFVDTGLEMAGVTKDTETRTSIVSSLKSVSMTSSKLLITTKSYMADPNAPNSKNLLTQAARYCKNSIICHFHVFVNATAFQCCLLVSLILLVNLNHAKAVIG